MQKTKTLDNKSIFSKSFKEQLKKELIPPLAELINTEIVYVEHMELAVNGYIAEFCDENSNIKIPDNLKEQPCCLVFTNIQEIYEWHKDFFLNALLRNRNSLSEIGKIFTQNEKTFHMYSKYCNFKEISNYLVNKHMDYFFDVQNKLGHSFQLQDLLITPLQRVTRYPILLKEILKYLKKRKLDEGLDSLNEALNTMQIVNKTVNEYTAVQGIQNYDGVILSEGKLIFHGSLYCKYDGKKRKLYVFLFKQKILFTVKKKAKTIYDSPTYDYRLQIPIIKLQMTEIPNNRFRLESTSPLSNVSVVCQASSPELYQQWLDAIRKQLEIKTDFLRNLVNPTSDDEDQRELLL